MLRINSISRDILDAKDIRVGGGNDKVVLRANSEGESDVSITRQDIVATGRMVALEYIGGQINQNKLAIEKYNSLLADSGMSYSEASRFHKERKLLYCAAMACKQTGATPPRTFEEFKRDNMTYAMDEVFMRTMASIDREILAPIYYDVVADGTAGLIQWEEVGFRSTKQIDILSNDVFLFEDVSWGSSRSVSKNYMYPKTITLNPQPIACNATIKWYQNAVAGDAGSYYAAIMRGLYSKVFARTMKTLNAAIENNTTNGYIPSGLISDTYTTANWLRIRDLVAASNGVSVNNGLMAIGTSSALANLLPVDANGGAMTGLQYGLGEAWFYNGYLPKAAGVDLFPVTPAIVPSTQNSTLDTIDTGDNIYILAKGLYRPLVGARYEGTPITLTATPSGGNGYAQGTADFTIDINVTATLDIQPVFASKVGVITSVYPTGD